MGKRLFSTLLVSCLAGSSLFAQTAPGTTDCSSKYLVRHPNIRKFYVGGGLDAAIFSTATIHHDGVQYDPSGASTPNTNTLGTLRFTYFLNIGATFNWNLSPHLGIYTGIDLKNVGYIERSNDSTMKRRTYNVGVPFGIKIGNMGKGGSYFLLGAGVDAPVNFEQKYFKTDDRNNKSKFDEWFSNRVPGLMPYAFIGGCFSPGVTVKAQYYINNFLNTDYTDNTGVKPYAGTEVHLFLLSVGFGMHMMHMEHKHKNCCSYNNSSSM